MALLPLTEIFYTLIIAIIIFPVLAGYGAQAQQLYSSDAEPEVACNNAGSDVYRGYYNNGPASCNAYLTFRSQYPCNTLSKIALLLNVDTKDVAQANPNCITHDDIEWNKLVYVPVNCSSDPSVSPYYLKSTYCTIGPADSFFHLANNTYQGLVTCQAIRFMNGIDQDPSNFAIGKRLMIPLRCACPTINQRAKGVISLLTYVVREGDTISSISREFMVDIKSIQQANGLSENSVIYPFTTLLIPVASMSGEYDGSSSSSSTSLRTTKTKKTAITIAKFTTISIGVTVSIVLSITVVIRAASKGRILKNCCNITIFWRPILDFNSVGCGGSGDEVNGKNGGDSEPVGGCGGSGDEANGKSGGDLTHGVGCGGSGDEANGKNGVDIETGMGIKVDFCPDKLSYGPGTRSCPDQPVHEPWIGPWTGPYPDQPVHGLWHGLWPWF